MSKETNEDWRIWYHHKMTPEERRQYNMDRHLTYKTKDNLRSDKWKKDNKEYCQAYQHTASIKKRYPIAFTENSPDHKQLLSWLLENKGKPCPYCGSPSLVIDHIHPLSKGGEHAFYNLQLICSICNFAKRDLLEEDFKGWIKSIIRQSLNQD
jgi:5-methylcytosine-specific restriction endonuclease McrA